MTFKILSVDGGGFRGVYAAHILARIEQEYNIDWKKTFNLLAGTSTGSIIVAGLACGIKATDICDFYKKHGSKIFKKRLIPTCGILSSKYNNKYFNSILKEIFKDRTLGEIDIPLILPATDIGNGTVHVFKTSYDKEFVRDRNVKVRDAILASCSAPTYFDPYKIENYFLVDGGIWANSPSLVAVIESMHRLDQKIDDLKVFSIGTGIQNAFYSQKNHWWHHLTGWGFASRWQGSKFIKMLLNLQAETANNMTKLLLQSDQLLRINFKTDSTLPLDNIKELNDLISRADRDFSHNAKKIKSFLNLK